PYGSGRWPYSLASCRYCPFPSRDQRRYGERSFPGLHLFLFYGPLSQMIKPVLRSNFIREPFSDISAASSGTSVTATGSTRLCISMVGLPSPSPQAFLPSFVCISACIMHCLPRSLQRLIGASDA